MTVMQLLAALNGQVAIIERHGALDRSVTSVTDDSRAVASGCLFVAVKGERVDGHRYVAQAIQAGAAAIVGQESVDPESLPFVKVADSRKALGLIGSRFGPQASAQELAYFEELREPGGEALYERAQRRLVAAKDQAQPA